MKILEMLFYLVGGLLALLAVVQKLVGLLLAIALGLAGGKIVNGDKDGPVQ